MIRPNLGGADVSEACCGLVDGDDEEACDPAAIICSGEKVEVVDVGAIGLVVDLRQTCSRFDRGNNMDVVVGAMKAITGDQMIKREQGLKGWVGGGKLEIRLM